MLINFFGKSDIGMQRSANQDFFIIRNICKNSSLAVVCDGMGGAKSGNVASECAAQVFADSVVKYLEEKIKADGTLVLTSKDACLVLDDAIRDANIAVYNKSLSSEDFEGMGTTLVGALFCDDTVYVINVGDSRLYLISNNDITQITHDHSYVQQLVDSGTLSPEEAQNHPFKNRITKAIGIADKVEPDIFSVDLSEIQICYLLLCTDGLSGLVSEEEICSLISSDIDIDVVTDIETELSDKTDRLIVAANNEGGTDNITALLVKVVKEL